MRLVHFEWMISEVAVPSINYVALGDGPNSGKFGLSNQQLKSETSGGNGVEKSSSDTVKISREAQQLFLRGSVLERQASMSVSELRNLHAMTRSMLIVFSDSVHGLGKVGLAANNLPNTEDADRLQLAQRAIDFAVAVHNYPPKKAENPFSGLDRKLLTSIIYDDTGYYAEAERYAAHYAAQQMDEDYFSGIIATLGSGDRRSFFEGAIEHFDNLSPVEKSIYPDGYREALQGYFNEEDERLAGFLELLLNYSLSKSGEATADFSMHDRISGFLGLAEVVKI